VVGVLHNERLDGLALVRFSDRSVGVGLRLERRLSFRSFGQLPIALEVLDDFFEVFRASFGDANKNLSVMGFFASK
jgi:hypothetical protein